MVHFYDKIEPAVGRNIEIKKLLSMILEQYRSVYKSGPDVVIDESMVPFRHHVAFRQCIPEKSHKYECKLYKLCTPSGYTLNLELYVGGNERTPPLSIVESLTVRLIRNHLNVGVTLFADNFYTSNFLTEYLLQHKTYLCGTVRVNRKNFLKTVLKVKPKRGKIKALESDKGVKVFN